MWTSESTIYHWVNHFWSAVTSVATKQLPPEFATWKILKLAERIKAIPNNIIWDVCSITHAQYREEFTIRWSLDVLSPILTILFYFPFFKLPCIGIIFYFPFFQVPQVVLTFLLIPVPVAITFLFGVLLVITRYFILENGRAFLVLKKHFPAQIQWTNGVRILHRLPSQPRADYTKN